MPVVDYSGISLAPMAGYSDMPFRRICRRFGSALSYTEFVSTDAMVRENVRTLQMLRFAEDERPVIFQIFGYDVDTIVEAALRLEVLRPDGIDLNLGCSVPKVAHKGSGAALLQNPEKIGVIIEAMVKRLRVPVSAKMRIGWSDFGQAVDIARRIEDAGASMLAVHGRTADQRYTGRADWSVIGAIREAVKIPLLGNGDIESRADAEERMRRYGVDGILIGRAAHGNPLDLPVRCKSCNGAGVKQCLCRAPAGHAGLSRRAGALSFSQACGAIRASLRHDRRTEITASFCRYYRRDEACLRTNRQ